MIWETLGIDPTTDKREIKRGYAARLKQVNPEDDPQGFQALRDAYQRALEMADQGAVIVQHVVVDGDAEGEVAEAPEGIPFKTIVVTRLQPGEGNGQGGLPPAPDLRAPDAVPTLPEISLFGGAGAGSGAETAPPGVYRLPLPEPALDEAPELQIELDLHLESDEELQRQFDDLRPPGPRPNVVHFAARRKTTNQTPIWKDEAPHEEKPKFQLMFDAAREVCDKLQQIHSSRRDAEVANLVRRRGWESFEFQQDLELSLVRFLGETLDVNYTLVPVFANLYSWQVGPTGKRGSANISTLMRRSNARHWRVAMEALPLGDLRKTAFELLRNPFNENAFRAFAQHVPKLEAMRDLIKQVQDKEPDAKQFEVHPQSFDWWQKNIDVLLKAHVNISNNKIRAQVKQNRAEAEQKAARIVPPIAKKSMWLFLRIFFSLPWRLQWFLIVLTVLLLAGLFSPSH